MGPSGRFPASEEPAGPLFHCSLIELWFWSARCRRGPLPVLGVSEPSQPPGEPESDATPSRSHRRRPWPMSQSRLILLSRWSRYVQAGEAGFDDAPQVRRRLGAAGGRLRVSGRTRTRIPSQARESRVGALRLSSTPSRRHTSRQSAPFLRAGPSRANLALAPKPVKVIPATSAPPVSRA